MSSKPVVRVFLEVDVHVEEEQEEVYLNVSRIRSTKVTPLGNAVALLLCDDEDTIDYDGKLETATVEAVRAHAREVWRGALQNPNPEPEDEIQGWTG